jgi:hypothetical protein
MVGLYLVETDLAINLLRAAAVMFQIVKSKAFNLQDHFVVAGRVSQNRF